MHGHRLGSGPQARYGPGMQTPEGHLPCRLCRSQATELVFRNLTDVTFRAVDGSWDLYRCSRCGAGFIQPPPTDAELVKAYTHYYTHQVPGRPYQGRIGPAQRWARAYTRSRYPADGRRSTADLGHWAPWPVRQRVDLRYRYLPRPQPGDRLLDVGCGSGSFLRMAESIGWTSVGIDFDEEAVARGRSVGLDASTRTLDELLEAQERFDAATMSHVIEHLPEPQKVLEQLYRLLRPGGFLFVSTPNMDARGRHRWGPHWRGLEVPRHLVLFSRSALYDTLTTAGFEKVQEHDSFESNLHTYERSWRLSRGRPLQGPGGPSRRQKLWLAWAACTDPGESETLQITARRSQGAS